MASTGDSVVLSSTSSSAFFNFASVSRPNFGDWRLRESSSCDSGILTFGLFQSGSANALNKQAEVTHKIRE